IVRRGPDLLCRGQTGVVAPWTALLPARARQDRPSVLLLEAADLLAGTTTAAAVGATLRRLQGEGSVSDANRVAARGLLAQCELASGELRSAIASAEFFLDAEPRALAEAPDGVL